MTNLPPDAPPSNSGSLYPETVHCSMCLGTGLTNTETGVPATNDEAHRTDVDQCAYCDGMGQFTDCPSCRGEGDGCENCDGGMVPGP